jgi:hypothetical protein
MTLCGLVLASCLAPPPQEAPGVEIRRRVTRTTLDLLGRREDRRREERLRIRDDALVIDDLTFGHRWVVDLRTRTLLHADLLASQYSRVSFDRLEERRKEVFARIRAARARVAGTADEAELGSLLEGFDRFDAAPRVESRREGSRVEILLNGDRRRASLELGGEPKAPGWFAALEATGAFPPGMGALLKELPSLPREGTLRYVFALERVVESFEVLERRDAPVPDADLAPPAGFQERPFRGVEPEPERRPAPPKEFKKDFKEDDAKGNP